MLNNSLVLLKDKVWKLEFWEMKRELKIKNEKKNKLWECFKAEKSQDKIVSKMEKEQMCFRNTNP